MAIELEVKLKDGVSVPAGSAAHQVDVLTRSLRAMQSQMVKAQALGDDKRFNRLATEYKKLKERADDLQKSMPKPTLFSRLGDAVKSVKVDDVVKGFSGMSLASLGVAGAIAAITAAAVGAAVAFAKLTRYAYDAAAGHNVLLAQLNALGGGAVQGEKVVDMARKLATVLPLTTKEIAGMAKEMMQAGIRDLPRLEQATKAIAASTAMVGDEGGKAMQSLVVDLHAAAQSASGISDLSGRLSKLGLTVEEVAKASGLSTKSYLASKMALDGIASTAPGAQKLGAVIQDLAIRKGIPAMQALGATVSKITEKLADNIAQLFVRIGETKGFKSFAIELQRFAQLFGLMDASGKSAESGLVSAFDKIFAVASKVMKGITIAILDLQIAINDVRIVVRKYQDDWNMLTNKAGESIVTWETVKTTLKGIAAIIGLLAVSVGGLVLTIMGPFIAIATGLAYLAGRMVEMGERIVNGIVEGIKKGQGALKATWNSMISELPSWAAKTLEVRSPSRVMMRLGLALPQGLEQGIEAGTPDAAGAAARMAMGAAGGGAIGVAAVAREGRGGGVVVNLAPGAIQVAGGNGESQTTLVEEAIVSMFERIALTQGVA